MISKSGLENEIMNLMLLEIIFEERKNYYADEKDKKKDAEMAKTIRRIIEKGVKQDEIQKNRIKGL